jgi:hypothetical protein
LFTLNKASEFPAIICFLLLVLMTGCKKDNTVEEPDDNDLTEVLAALETEAEGDDMLHLTEAVLRKFETEINDTTLTGTAQDSGQCWMATLYHDKDSIAVDFDGTCQAADSRFREGVLSIVYDQQWRLHLDSAIQVTPANFFISNQPITSTEPGSRLEGTYRLVNIDSTDNGLSTRVIVSNARLSKPDGGFSSWNSERVREFSAGSATVADQLDDEYRVTSGTSTGSRNNRAFRIDVTQPVLWKRACQINNGIYNPVSGSIQVKVQGKSNRIINYGNGACDKEATVTIGTATQTITLR